MDTLLKIYGDDYKYKLIIK